MEVDYASALQQLEAMFPNFDDETFRTVLASNGIEPPLAFRNKILVFRWTFGKNNRRFNQTCK